MIVDFQHHFTPPELVRMPAVQSMSINKAGSTPPYRMPAELTDITAHVRDMDAAGATMPNQLTSSTPGTPASAKVGTSG